MINGKYHVERNYLGKKIMIDIAEISPRWYEVMVFDNYGEEIASMRCDSLDIAVDWFNYYCKNYEASEKPLTGKYAKLVVDLISAYRKGKKAADESTGRGTCNLDAPMILLPRWKGNLVKRAFAEADIPKPSKRNDGWYIIPVCFGQDWANTVGVEAMSKALKELGYDSSVWYCVD